MQNFSLLRDDFRHPILNERHNIVVISDEAHRSQYGLKATLDGKTGRYKFGYAKHLRDALPNASFIGFTGTPIATDDKVDFPAFTRHFRASLSVATVYLLLLTFRVMILAIPAA